jgi:hypothetical protein
MVRLIAVIVSFLLTLSSAVLAEESQTTYTSVEFLHYAKRGTGSYTGLLAYGEKELWDIGRNTKAGLYGQGYYDPTFLSGILGGFVTRGNLQLAIGFGSSRYGNVDYPTINPWIYYEDKAWGLKASAYWEIYGQSGRRADHWGKGYVLKYFGDVPVGVSWARYMGIGPSIGYRLPQVEVLVTRPVLGQSEESSERVRLLVGAKVEF